MRKTSFLKINMAGILILFIITLIYCYGSEGDIELTKNILNDYSTLRILSYHGIRPTEAQIKEEEKQWERIIADISAHEHGIIDILKNGNLDFRKIAACALVEIKSSKAVAALNEILENTGENIELRSLAAQSLGRIGGQKAVEALKVALKDPLVSLDAACALADFGDPAAIEPLLNGLRKSEYNSSSFFTAVAGLEKIKDLRAVELLIAILKDCNHEYSRNTIAHALYNIITKKFGRDDIKWLEFIADYVKWKEWWEQNKEELNDVK